MLLWLSLTNGVKKVRRETETTPHHCTAFIIHTCMPLPMLINQMSMTHDRNTNLALRLWLWFSNNRRWWLVCLVISFKWSSWFLCCCVICPNSICRRCSLRGPTTTFSQSPQSAPVPKYDWNWHLCHLHQIGQRNWIQGEGMGRILTRWGLCGVWRLCLGMILWAA